MGRPSKEDRELWKVFRQYCECGSTVRFGGAGDLADMRGLARLNRLLANVPPGMHVQAMETGFFWWCADSTCDGAGVFLDPDESGDAG